MESTTATFDGITVATGLWPGNQSTPLNPNSNGTQTNEDVILAAMRDLKIGIFEPTIAYIALLMLLGIPGNSLVLYIYLRTWKRNTVRIFIISLAILDVTCCIFVYPMELVIIHNPYVFDYPGICKLSRFSTYIITCSSSLILLSIAADRFHRICRPFQIHINPQKAKIICLICLGIALFFVWPSLLIYGVDKMDIVTPEGNITATPCLLEHAYKDTHYPIIFITVLFLTSISIFIVLCVLYAFVAFIIFRHGKRWSHSGSLRSWSQGPQSKTKETSQLKNHNESRKMVSPGVPHIPSKCRPKEGEYTAVNQATCEQGSKDKGRKESGLDVWSHCSPKPDSAQPRQRRFTFTVPRMSADKKITLMLFVVTVVYIVSFLPFLILATYRAMNPKYILTLSESWESVYQLVLRSYLINSAVNPLIYSFCNAKFRYECKKLFKRMIGYKSS